MLLCDEYASGARPTADRAPDLAHRPKRGRGGVVRSVSLSLPAIPVNALPPSFIELYILATR